MLRGTLLRRSGGKTPEIQVPAAAAFSQFPLLQYPSRNLLTRQQFVSTASLHSDEFKSMVTKLIDTRKHYQYPSLAAPQIGWNVRVFTLWDGSVWVNPEVTVPEGDSSEALPVDSVIGADAKTARLSTKAWAWEPCASTACLLHYIERPLVVDVTATCGKTGGTMRKRLGGMHARMVQHEMDHLEGVNFTRRIPDSAHVIPIDGFPCMSDWRCDFPSLEAASTNLYTLMIPPAGFSSVGLKDADLLNRHLSVGVFPEHELYAAMRKEEERYMHELAAFIAKNKQEGDKAADAKEA